MRSFKLCLSDFNPPNSFKTQRAGKSPETIRGKPRPTGDQYKILKSLNPNC